MKTPLRDWYRGVLPPGRSTPLQLVMIQSTMFCNINCAYCYLPARTSKKKFDLAMLPTVIERLDEASLLGAEITIAWHAGEPLVLPVSFYREANEIIEQHTPAGTNFRHSFQTNGILISDAYCEFFKETEALIGVSIDGPEFLHDKRRVTRDGKGTFQRAMAGFDKLRKAGVPAASISVLSLEALDHPDELYDFFKGLGVTEAGFNIEEIEGENKHSSMAAAEAQEKVRSFFRRLLQRVEADPDPLRIRDIENGRNAALSSLVSTRAGAGESNPLSIISIDADGRVSSFSPELLQVPGEMDYYTFGNIRDLDFTRLWENERFLAMYEPIVRGIAKCRAECIYFGACAGGAPANKLAENGTFDSSETLHCRLAKQAVVDVMDEALIGKLAERQAAKARRSAPRPDTQAAAKPPRAVGQASVAAKPPRAVGGAASGVAGSAKRAAPILSGSDATRLFGGAPVPVQSASPRVAVPSAEEGELFPYFGSVNVYAPRERIQVSSGTSSAGAAGLDGGRYKPGALVPRQDWRPCSAAEYDQLQSSGRCRGALNFVAVVTPPDEIRALARRMGDDALALHDAGGDPEEPTLYPTAEPSRYQNPEAEAELARRLHELFAMPNTESKSLGMLVHRSGAVTKTFDNNDRLLLGLHLDTWFKQMAHERIWTNNRIAINMGASSRRLLVMDVGLDQIVGLLRTPEDPHPERRGASELGRDFMWRHPDYPVLSIEIRPGEAYIAATENIIHDASTADMAHRDVMLTLLGRFHRDRALPYVDQPALPAAA